MTLRVRFFSSLREAVGQGECLIPYDGIRTVTDVWDRACPGRAMPVNCLAAVNMEYVATNQPVLDGDEVAFFPPVTGG